MFIVLGFEMIYAVLYFPGSVVLVFCFVQILRLHFGPMVYFMWETLRHIAYYRPGAM